MKNRADWYKCLYSEALWIYADRVAGNPIKRSDQLRAWAILQAEKKLGITLAQIDSEVIDDVPVPPVREPDLTIGNSSVKVRLDRLELSLILSALQGTVASQLASGLATAAKWAATAIHGPSLKKTLDITLFDGPPVCSEEYCTIHVVVHSGMPADIKPLVYKAPSDG